MDIKTIRLSSLEANPAGTLRDCANSGEPLLVELPDHRFVALQPVPNEADDSLIDDLLESNYAFQELVAKSKAGMRNDFVRSANQ